MDWADVAFPLLFATLQLGFHEPDHFNSALALGLTMLRRMIGSSFDDFLPSNWPWHPPSEKTASTPTQRLTDDGIMIQILMEKSLRRLHGGTGTRDHSRGIAGIGAVAVGGPNGVLVGAAVLPGDL